MRAAPLDANVPIDAQAMQCAEAARCLLMRSVQLDAQR
jgi:hypothetical protein